MTQSATKLVSILQESLTAEQGNEDFGNEIDYKSTKVFINPACFPVYVDSSQHLLEHPEF